MNTELSEIDQIIVTYASSNGLQQYHYDPRDNNTEVIGGLTFVNNIPLSNVTNNEILIQVSTAINRAINPGSSEFTTAQCGAALDSTDIAAGTVVYYTSL